MKTPLRTLRLPRTRGTRLLPLLSALALPALALAQTTPVSPPATPPRFADFTAAPATVATPAQAVTSLAESIRLGISSVPATTNPLTAAVAQASTAIIREGQTVRADSLASRQATLTRLRLAQTDADRQKLVEDLRLHSGERLDDQRETARLVRDRLRQVRDNAALTRPATP